MVGRRVDSKGNIVKNTCDWENAKMGYLPFVGA